MFHSSQHNSQTPLLQLPAELRNAIYAFVLTDPNSTPIFVNFTVPRLSVDKRLVYDAKATIPRRVALLGTCRQIYQETSVLPLGLNTLRFTSVYRLWTTLPRVPLKLRKQIRSIALRYGVYQPSRDTLRFVAGMKNPGIISLEDVLPNIQSVEVHFVNVLTHYFGSFPRIPDKEEISEEREMAKEALLAWLKGNNENVRVIATGR